MPYRNQTHKETAERKIQEMKESKKSLPSYEEALTMQKKREQMATEMEKSPSMTKKI